MRAVASQQIGIIVLISAWPISPGDRQSSGLEHHLHLWIAISRFLPKVCLVPKQWSKHKKNSWVIYKDSDEKRTKGEGQTENGKLKKTLI